MRSATPPRSPRAAPPRFSSCPASARARACLPPRWPSGRARRATCRASGPVRSLESLSLDLGRVVFGHIVGNVTAKPALRGLLIGEPTTDTVILKHPSGRRVEIRVVAGARAGSSLVARWSAGAIFDEAPRMLGEEDGVVNFDDARRAVLGRLLPGAQLVAVGSPWAPRGPVYEAVQEYGGKPSDRLVIVRAPAPAMNPVWWTPERVEQLRRQDEQAWRTDVLGEFADPESSLFSSAELDAVTRKGPLVLPRPPGHACVAAMDPGTRGNAWTLIIATLVRIEGKVCTRILRARQWQGSKGDPLDPDRVLGEIAAECLAYDVRHVVSDQWGADFVATVGRRHGLHVLAETITAPRKVELYESLRARIAVREVEIPDDPLVRADLLSVRKRVTMNGIAIELPRTADGRHADYAPALALAVERASRLPPPPALAPVDHEALEQARRVRQEEKRFGPAGRKVCATCRGAGCSHCAGLGNVRRRERSRPACGGYPS
jgi:hypothetical protein